MTDPQRDEAEEAMLALAAPLNWRVIAKGRDYYTEGKGYWYAVVKVPETGRWRVLDHPEDPFEDDPFAENSGDADAKVPALTYASCAAAQKACVYHKVFGKWE